MTDLIAIALLLTGGFFCMIAGIGVVRLNDVYARMHAATKAGTLGLALICVAVMVRADTWLQVAEAAFVFLFMIASAPVGAHLIGRAAFRRHRPIDPQTQADPDTETFRSPKPGASAVPSGESLAQAPDHEPDNQNDGNGEQGDNP